MKTKQMLVYCIGLLLSVSSIAVTVECKKESLLNRGTHVLISDANGSLSIIFRERDVLLLSGEAKSIERIYINATCDFSEQSIACKQSALDDFMIVEKPHENIYTLSMQRKGKKVKNIIFQKNECSFAF
jgi:hypothetical protein